MSIEPFRIAVSDDELADLGRRIRATRWPDQLPDSGWSYGTDLDALRQQGFSDSDIWDIGAVAAFFNLSNRMANLAGLRPNREFYTMGRGQ